MRVFVTGATGFIGTAVIKELIGAGHHVLGLSRSVAGAKALISVGAQAHRGDLEDLESLRSGATQSDAVIHAGFVHDFSRFKEVCEIDQRAIEAIGSVLAGSKKHLLVSSGVAGLSKPGQLATEDFVIPADYPLPRASEQTAFALKDVSASSMRLSQIHNPVKQGLVTYLIALAREKGLSAYVGEGKNCWAAAHVTDTAHLYRLALEKGEAGAKYHAVAEEGVPLKDIAESIGRGLKIPVKSLSPEEAAVHFGWMTMFASADLAASSEITRTKMGWNPTGPGLIADLEKMDYSGT
jgi:nucleoside-diphosphate-sugar epimerase